MPVKQCTVDGQEGWKWGDEGKCYIGPDSKKKAINQGIAIGEYAKNRISFDFDGVLSTEKGKEIAKNAIENGDDVYVISARKDTSEIDIVAKELGISLHRVYATGSNKKKIEFVRKLKINTHYDDNEDVLSQLGSVGKKI